MEPEYVIKRSLICQHCPICDIENEICNAHLYLNPKTNDVSVEPKEGYIKGCGCYINYKIRRESNKCPCGKW